jgi:hypothetical protein
MIKIHTQLHVGIHRAREMSGVVYTCPQRNPSPRSLLLAVKRLNAIRASNVRSYGTLGAGRSWITVYGVRLADEHVETTDDALYALRELGEEASERELEGADA